MDVEDIMEDMVYFKAFSMISSFSIPGIGILANLNCNYFFVFLVMATPFLPLFFQLPALFRAVIQNP